MINLSFVYVPRKSISLDEIHRFIEDGEPKRIHFATTHSGSLKLPSNEYGKILVPFKDTINSIIVGELGAHRNLFPSKFGGYWRGFSSKEEFEEFNKFVDNYQNIVFLRDCLDLSICLSMNINDDGHTEIGDWENEAKYKGNKESEQQLVDTCKKWVDTLPYYKEADYICAMPCSNRSEKSLPRRIVDALDGFENISKNVYWESKTRSLKDAESVEGKLAILEESNLVIDRKLEGKAVFLLDDLYMSGLSMQYVAMKLKEAGAKWVFGLCLVKSRNNTTR